ncbi:rod shape-determining protein MreC [Haematospirillum sp. 15-248]|uniref:rod shape-determining protein MreC n=1 Tax=Haematospirillum sp. 15-248 TaxID=2723107 RepID=UPI00143CAEB9|nr:rod shape-determining protein MreC [Haematospirillum sp. 15-248]NKD87446.1 rod shape-determining protein MreC [Haematospirillum sp. 15-248]
MKQSAPTSTRLSHLRTLFGRFAFVVLVILSFALMLVGKADTVAVRSVRIWVADALVPVMDVMSQPASFITAVTANIRELAAIREENARLRDENARLLRWQTAARVLETENESLRQLMHFVPGPQATFVSARVVADTGGAFAHSVLVTAGARELVSKGHAVVSGEGLVGRVIETGRRASRVLLLTDINSRIPVAIGNARQRAILAGDNTDRPRLMFSRGQMAVVPGDRVATSGVAGVFPPGLPVGVVASVNDGEIRIKPYYQRDRLEYVRVVDYGVSDVISDLASPSIDGAAGESRTEKNR